MNFALSETKWGCPQNDSIYWLKNNIKSIDHYSTFITMKVNMPLMWTDSISHHATTALTKYFGQLATNYVGTITLPPSSAHLFCPVVSPYCPGISLSSVAHNYMAVGHHKCQWLCRPPCYKLTWTWTWFCSDSLLLRNFRSLPLLDAAVIFSYFQLKNCLLWCWMTVSSSKSRYFAVFIHYDS